MARQHSFFLCLAVIGASACSGGSVPSDAGMSDAGMSDAGMSDAGMSDAGESDSGVSDAGGADAGTVDSGYPAPTPAPPQVQNQGGPVLASPEVVAVFFSNDNDPGASVADMTSFYQGLSASSFWGTLSEYGVGPITSTKAVTLAESAPMTIDDSTTDGAFATWLQNEITSGKLPANKQGTTLYAINYPLGTTVTQAGATSCTDFAGYHSDLQMPNGDLVAYAVVPRCDGQSMGFNTNLESVTSSASHELAELTTDPYGDFMPGWAQVDDAHMFWDEANSGSEIGDLCQNDPEAYFQFSDFPYVVQRIWSNQAAAAGHDPCVPAYPGEVYFTAVPELKDGGTFSYNGQSFAVTAVKIPVGQSATIPIDLASDGPMTAWAVDAQDWNSYFNNGTPLLSLSLSPGAGKNGDQLQLTIKVNSAGDGNTEPQNTELFVLSSQSGTGNNAIQHFWYGIVTN